MKLLLTPELLLFLTESGFRYAYSRTTLARAGSHAVDVTLTPLITQPTSVEFSDKYDTWYDLTQEPAEMARHTDDALIFVELDKDTMANYFKAVLHPENIATGAVGIRFTGEAQAQSTGA